MGILKIEEFLEFELPTRKILEEVYIKLEPQYNMPSTNGLIKIAILNTARELLKKEKDNEQH